MEVKASGFAIGLDEIFVGVGVGFVAVVVVVVVAAVGTQEDEKRTK